MADFPSWPTFPSGLEGDWVDADRVLATNVMEYETPNRLIMELFRNENCKSKRYREEPASCDEIMGALTKRQVKAVELIEQGNTREEAGALLGVGRRAVTYRIEFARNRIKNLPK